MKMQLLQYKGLTFLVCGGHSIKLMVI